MFTSRALGDESDGESEDIDGTSNDSMEKDETVDGVFSSIVTLSFRTPDLTPFESRAVVPVESP